MKQILIHVSPFTKRILTQRYQGAEPFNITQSDAVYTHLSIVPLRNNNCLTKINKNLTETALIRVSAGLYRRLNACKRKYLIGQYLHKAFQEKMLTFVEAQVLAEIPAQRALKTFLDRNNISEDDYSLETAYTAWKRYKAVFYPKNTIKNALFWQRSGLKNRPEWCEKNNTLPAPPIWVLRSVNNYFQCGYTHLICNHIRIEHNGRSFTYHFDSRSTTKHIYERKILAYLLHKHSSITTMDITKIIKRDVSRIRRYIQQIRFEVDNYPKVSKDIACIQAFIERERTNMRQK